MMPNIIDALDAKTPRIPIDEFITFMIDVPWVEGKASFAECDCWGLVVLYYRHVVGIELAPTHDLPMVDGMAAQLATGQWQEVTQPSDGVVFMSYRDGNPAHCGIIIGNRVLHSAGGRNRDGYCRFDRFATLQRTYRDMRYFIHKGAA